MYVCICNAVTDKQIRASAREGCTSLRALSCQTGCATTCGKCARMAREILVDEMQRQVQWADKEAARDVQDQPTFGYPA